MKILRGKRCVAALDFGLDKVRVLIAQKEASGFKARGFAEAAAQGIENGEITCLGDAVECIVEAAGRAEKAAGVRIGKLYYNLNDARMQSLHSRESKILSGEGEIRPSDIRDIRKTAERLAAQFEKRIVYCRETRFLVDDKDFVNDPVGVFGRKLDVFVHVVLAEAAVCESWRRLLDRVPVQRGVPVISPWSAAYGITAPEERAEKKLIVDAGRDFIHCFIFGKSQIEDTRTMPAFSISAQEAAEKIIASSRPLLDADSPIREILVTGDLADAALAGHLQKALCVSCRPASARLAGFEEPRYASLVGLLSVAAELESKRPVFDPQKNWLATARQEVVSFLKEYF